MRHHASPLHRVLALKVKMWPTLSEMETSAGGHAFWGADKVVGAICGREYTCYHLDILPTLSSFGFVSCSLLENKNYYRANRKMTSISLSSSRFIVNWRYHWLSKFGLKEIGIRANLMGVFELAPSPRPPFHNRWRKIWMISRRMVDYLYETGGQI